MPSRLLPRAAAGLPPTFWWLFAGVLVMALATFVFPFLTLFLASRGFSGSEAGLVMALFGTGSIPAGPLAGQLADRVGRRPTLLASLVVSAALTALLPALTSPLPIALVTLALGVAAHGYFPAANAVVADLLRPERYGDAYGLMYWVRNAGIAFSFVVGGALATRGGYGNLFLLDAATTLLFAAVVWWKVPETRPAAPAARTGGPERGWGAVLGDRHLRRVLLLNLLFLLTLFQFMVAVPLAMAGRGFSPELYGRIMAVNGLLIVTLQPLAGRLSGRFPPASVLAFAALLVGAGYGAYALCATAWQFAAATAVWSLGEILTIPVISALVAELSPADLRGRYQGLLGLSFGAGLALAPALGGAVLERLGAGALWAGASALCALVAAGHLLAGRARAGGPASADAGLRQAGSEK